MWKRGAEKEIGFVSACCFYFTAQICLVSLAMFCPQILFWMVTCSSGLFFFFRNQLAPIKLNDWVERTAFSRSSVLFHWIKCLQSRTSFFPVIFVHMWNIWHMPCKSYIRIYWNFCLDHWSDIGWTCHIFLKK